MYICNDFICIRKNWMCVQKAGKENLQAEVQSPNRLMRAEITK